MLLKTSQLESEIPEETIFLEDQYLVGPMEDKQIYIPISTQLGWSFKKIRIKLEDNLQDPLDLIQEGSLIVYWAILTPEEGIPPENWEETEFRFLSEVKEVQVENQYMDIILTKPETVFVKAKL